MMMVRNLYKAQKEQYLMPINVNKLQEVLAEMKKTRLKKGKTSVKDHSFIDLLHNYCVAELERSGLNTKKKDITVITKKSIPRLDKPKEVDVCILHKTAGPLLNITIKSLMSSITNNFTNNYEQLIGDVSLFHERFPTLVMGSIFLLPKDVQALGYKKETYPLAYYAQLLSKLADRQDYNNNPNRFESIAFLIVDFSKNPPKIVQTIPHEPNLRIETFFDKLVTKYLERNSALNIR